MWKQSFMMNQQWFKGVLMIIMMTTKDDDKGDEQKAQKIEEQLKWIKNKSRVQESRRIQDSRRKSTINNQDSRFKISRIKIKIQDSRFKNEEKTQSR